jgi:hypothetical protein
MLWEQSVSCQQEERRGLATSSNTHWGPIGMCPFRCSIVAATFPCYWLSHLAFGVVVVVVFVVVIVVIVIVVVVIIIVVLVSLLPQVVLFGTASSCGTPIPITSLSPPPPPPPPPPPGKRPICSVYYCSLQQNIYLAIHYLFSFFVCNSVF